MTKLEKLLLHLEENEMVQGVITCPYCNDEFFPLVEGMTTKDVSTELRLMVYDVRKEVEQNAKK